MNIKKHIPNFITILNLVCGVLAIKFFISSGYLYYDGPFCILDPEDAAIKNGIYLIFAAMVLDFLDGFTARLLNVKSEIGAQLDSLADMVSFGVAPGFLFYSICRSVYPEIELLAHLFILIPIFSAIRLAKFNIDTEQTTYFKGLATPANALFWTGMFYFPFWDLKDEISLAILLFAVISMSLLMISNLRMFSLKFTDTKFEGDNVYRYLLLSGGVILTIIFGMFTNILAAIPFIILLYILLSVSYHYSTKTTLTNKD